MKAGNYLYTTDICKALTNGSAAMADYTVFVVVVTASYGGKSIPTTFTYVKGTTVQHGIATTAAGNVAFIRFNISTSGNSIVVNEGHGTGSFASGSLGGAVSMSINKIYGIV